MIYFFNTFHNGDVHYSRTFVKDMMNKLGKNDYCYLHNNKPEILKDIQNLKHDNAWNSFSNWNLISDYPINYISRIIKKDNDVYINTWVGQQKWITKKNINRNRDNRYCSLYSLYEMYEDIYEELSIPIEKIDFYIPDIDFEYIEKNNIDNFMLNNKYDYKILIVNNEPRTVRIKMDMELIVNELSDKYKNILFILTNKIELSKENVAYTNDIIKLNSDLNEIGYLSKYCDIIVGRPSGPYCFCMNKDTMIKNKTFLTISNNKYDCFYFESDVDMLFLDEHTSESLINMLENKIKELL